MNKYTFFSIFLLTLTNSVQSYNTRDSIKEHIINKVTEERMLNNDDDISSLNYENLIPQANIIKNISYGQETLQNFDLYIPKNSQTQFSLKPIIIFVHGGGWIHGDKTMKNTVLNKANFFVNKNYIFASINYRLDKNIDVTEKAQDIADAISFIQKNSAKYKININDITLMGHSAGAHLSMLVSTDMIYINQSNAIKWNKTISLDSGGLNIVNVMNKKHYKLYDPIFGKNEEFWKLTSPTIQLNKNSIANFLIVCSDKRQGPCEESEEFLTQSKLYTKNVQILSISEGHSWINDELGKNKEYTQKVYKFINSY